jgi:hypothetical protein
MKSLITIIVILIIVAGVLGVLEMLRHTTPCDNYNPYNNRKCAEYIWHQNPTCGVINPETINTLKGATLLELKIEIDNLCDV